MGVALKTYGNIGIVAGPADKFVTPEKLDLVWTGLTYHDLHEKIDFDGQDVAAVNKAVYAALKPGGTYIVLDRASKPGAGLSDLDTLYRIDEATVKAEIEGGGFPVRRRKRPVAQPGRQSHDPGFQGAVGRQAGSVPAQIPKPRR